MAIDRDAIVKRAERLVQQGRLDGAIEEYVRLVAAQPKDWNARNALGDLYARRGDTSLAATEYLAFADHLKTEGFLPRAAAFYKKILKIDSVSEPALRSLADVAARQGLLADAKVYVRRLAALLRDRGDVAGVEDCVLQLADIDAGDRDTVRAAVKIAGRRGEAARAAGWLVGLAESLERAGQAADALEPLLEAAALVPGDVELRTRAVGACMAAGAPERATALLDLAVCGDEPDLLLLFATRELAEGREAEGVAALTRMLLLSPDGLPAVERVAREFVEAGAVDLGFRCLEVGVDAAVLAEEWSRAEALLAGFVEATGFEAARARLEEVRGEAGTAPAEGPAADGPHGDPAPVEPAALDPELEALLALDEPLAEETGPEFDAGTAPGAPDELPGETGAEEDDREVPVSLSGTGEATTISGSLVINAEDVDLSTILSGLRAAPQPTLERPAPDEEAAPAAAPDGDEGAAVPDLDAVFAGMRADAEGDLQFDSGDSAYRQALDLLARGRADEAAIGLRTAARDPRLRFDAASRLGDLYRERGEHRAAVEWLERAAEAPAPTPEGSHGVLYALADALDRVGEPARALAVLIELEGEAPGYRDARARIEQLTQALAGGRAR